MDFPFVASSVYGTHIGVFTTANKPEMTRRQKDRKTNRVIQWITTETLEGSRVLQARGVKKTI